MSRVPGHGPGGEVRGGYSADVVSTINRVRTDLDAFSRGEQMVLERHGYLVADDSVHRHSPATVALQAPLDPPHPEVAGPKEAVAMLRGSARITALGRR